jgi:4-alpha-glucanotransferase
MQTDRAAGVFLHVAALPGPDGVGTLGDPARSFVDYLARGDVGHWQFCPVGPTATVHGNSPYSALSAFAGNPLFVDLDALRDRGLLTDADLADRPSFPADRVDYDAVTTYKREVLRTAHGRFRDGEGEAGWDAAALSAFREASADWLPDYTLFRALRERHGGPWTDWPAPVRDRDPAALSRAREELATDREYYAFRQFCFDRQFDALRAYAADRGVSLVGDVPIYVGHDSADVWATPSVFQLDAAGRPTATAGVPDAPGEPFAAQNWGSPVYDWDALVETDFRWWRRRLSHLLARVDLVRVDHFRGLETYWAIPADADDANEGEWRPVPSEAFFDAVVEEVGDADGDLPAFAEDIGHMTEAVQNLRRRYGLPSLRLLPFADWCDDDHPHRPANYPEDCVAFTSTHDSDTALGTYRSLPADQRRCLAAAPEVDVDGAEGADVHWALLESVWASDAVLAFAPLQDVLGLGSEARYNVPGTPRGNWEWRVRGEQLTDESADRLAAVTARHGR